MNDWVKLRSWHRVIDVENNIVTTRCGRLARIVKARDWQDADQPVSPTSDTLPLGERSCETCLRLTAHDQERATNDEVAG